MIFISLKLVNINVNTFFKINNVRVFDEVISLIRYLMNEIRTDKSCAKMSFVKTR